MTKRSSPKQAARNVYWFNWLSYAIAVGLLAGATRDAITKVVRDWKLPGFTAVFT
ncbi:MAG: hypothetical protein DSM106950_23755 [Stigonema ocellatum SAG 48.90 = DSM 106950]|nr:hypothetical protein [Stigonema ocellatum SAG 48.90 = DSM 106950]